MALLTTQTAAPAGTTVTYAAASAGGDTLQPGERTHLHVKCGATGCTVTVDSIRACDQGFDHNLSVVVGTNAEVLIGPLPASRFANLTTGLVSVTYSQVTTVTVAAVSS